MTITIVATDLDTARAEIGLKKAEPDISINFTSKQHTMTGCHRFTGATMALPGELCVKYEDSGELLAVLGRALLERDLWVLFADLCDREGIPFDDYGR